MLLLKENTIEPTETKNNEVQDVCGMLKEGTRFEEYLREPTDAGQS